MQTNTHWFKEKYRSVLPKIKTDFGFSSPMQLPKIEKVVLNMGAGKEVSNSKAIEEVEKELTIISGQKPIKVKAKNSLASWKLREGMAMGAKVTLRGEKMWSFLAKLISVVLPRVRDFRGLNPNSFDQQGNYSLGIKEQIVFPEINFENIRKVRGLDVIIVIKSPSTQASKALLQAIGFPFAKEKGEQNK